MSKVYGVPASPFVRKTMAFLEEKKVAYTLEPIMPVNTGPEFRKISPLGKIPAYEDESIGISDSSVICAYLEKKHPTPALYPSDAALYARALWMEEYADTTLAAALGRIFYQEFLAPTVFNKPTDHEVVKKTKEEDLPPIFDYLESQVREGTPVVGEMFGIADISLGTHFANYYHLGYTVDGARWPALKAYVEWVLSRPTFKKLIEAEKAFFKKAA